MSVKRPVVWFVVSALSLTFSPSSLRAQGAEAPPEEPAQDQPAEDTPEADGPGEDATAESGEAGQGGTEKKEKRFDFLILPDVAVSPEEGARLGIYSFVIFERLTAETAPIPTALAINAWYTTKRLFNSYIDFQGATADAGYLFRVRPTFRYRPTSYFGTGPDVADDDQEGYVLWNGRLDAFGRRALTEARNLYVGMRYQFSVERLTLEEGGALDTARPTGFEGGRRSGIAPEIYWDNRDSPLTPREGSYLNVALFGFHRFLGSEFDYGRLLVDGRGYRRLYKDHSVAGRFLYETAFGEVPFYELPLMGGVIENRWAESTRNRGILGQRFRDRHLLNLQAEYRSPAIWRLRGVVFANVGTVAPSLGELDVPDGLQFGAGAGLRVRITQKQWVRIDLAFSNSGMGFYLDVNDAY